MYIVETTIKNQTEVLNDFKSLGPFSFESKPIFKGDFFKVLSKFSNMRANTFQKFQRNGPFLKILAQLLVNFSSSASYVIKYV